MINNAENNKRIAKNTGLLYCRMLVTLLISLYTSRVILQTIGVENYGIYNVIAGFVTMFNLITGALSVSISRFLNFELGRSNISRLSNIFTTAIITHIGLACVILIFAELIGVWFINTQLNISENRLIAAHWVFQCSLVSFLINLISIPYNALIISHERMSAFAYISIAETILKLLIVYLLLLISYDKLVTYALLMLVTSVITRFIYSYYCHKHFNECNQRKCFDKKIFKEMLGFTSWNFIGSTSVIFSDQGVNMLLNIFEGAVVNAARGIAMQVNTAVNGFSQNFMTAMNPQIIKNYATSNFKYLYQLIFSGAKFSFFLLLILSLPIIFNTDIILYTWLNTVPEHTANFIRLILIFTMSEVLSSTLTTALLSTGEIIKLQLLIGGSRLLNFPLAYLCLQQKLAPEITIINAIIISQLCLLIRLLLAKKMLSLSLMEYVKDVYFKILAVALFSSLIAEIIQNLIKVDSFLKFIINSVLVVLCTIIIIIAIGLNSSERRKIAYFIKNTNKNDQKNNQ